MDPTPITPTFCNTFNQLSTQSNVTTTNEQIRPLMERSHLLHEYDASAPPSKNLFRLLISLNGRPLPIEGIFTVIGLGFSSFATQDILVFPPNLKLHNCQWQGPGCVAFFNGTLAIDGYDVAAFAIGPFAKILDNTNVVHERGKSYSFAARCSSVVYSKPTETPDPSSHENQLEQTDRQSQYRYELHLSQQQYSSTLKLVISSEQSPVKTVVTARYRDGLRWHRPSLFHVNERKENVQQPMPTGDLDISTTEFHEPIQIGPASPLSLNQMGAFGRTQQWALLNQQNSDQQLNQHGFIFSGLNNDTANGGHNASEFVADDLSQVLDRLVESDLQSTAAGRVKIYNKEGGILSVFDQEAPTHGTITGINSLIKNEDNFKALTSEGGLKLGNVTVFMKFQDGQAMDCISFEPFGDPTTEWCLLSLGENTFNLITAETAKYLMQKGNLHTTRRDPKNPANNLLRKGDFLRGEAVWKLFNQHAVSKSTTTSPTEKKDKEGCSVM